MSRVAKERTERAKRLLNPPEERPLDPFDFLKEEEETKKEFNGTLNEMLKLAGLKRRKALSVTKNKGR